MYKGPTAIDLFLFVNFCFIRYGDTSVQINALRAINVLRGHPRSQS